mgnify:FL=1
MTPTARHENILAQLAQRGEVNVNELAEELGVDRVTIRRDLSALEAQRLLHRTHGGAVPSRLGSVQFTFHEKQETQQAQKAAIGAAVAELIEPGMTVSLDTGTTTLAVAQALQDCRALTVLTSSLAVASILYPQDGIRLVILGGMVRSESPDLFGPITQTNLRSFRVDLSVQGADGVGPDGLFTTDPETSSISQAMMAGAETSVLVVDSSKFGQHAFVRFAGWDDIDHVVTDDGLTPEHRAWLESAGPGLTYARVGTGRGKRGRAST